VSNNQEEQNVALGMDVMLIFGVLFSKAGCEIHSECNVWICRMSTSVLKFNRSTRLRNVGCYRRLDDKLRRVVGSFSSAIERKIL
jgi:hypothetical protein